jgi:hypothetical protein
MFDRQTISSFLFTIAVAISTICWLLLGYDSVGDPLFDNQAALLLQLSVLLPFFASVWFVFEGNVPDSSTRNLTVGFIAGWVLTFGWMISTGWESMPGIIPVLLVFLFPMGMLFLALLILSVVLCVIGFALGGFLRKVMRKQHLAS